MSVDTWVQLLDMQADLVRSKHMGMLYEQCLRALQYVFALVLSCCLHQLAPMLFLTQYFGDFDCYSTSKAGYSAEVLQLMVLCLGTSLKQPDVPKTNCLLQARQPAARHQQPYSEAEALHLTQQRQPQEQHAPFAHQHQGGSRKSQTQYVRPSSRSTNAAQQGSVAPPSFFSDLFPREVS